MNFIRRLVITLIIGVISIMGLANVVTAANETVGLYSAGEVPIYFYFAELEENVKYVFHKVNGVEFPAYCLNRRLQGVTASNPYSVDINGEITDEMIFRIIINGYPYKTVEQLGCKNVMEAYTATQYAIYSYQSNDLKGSFLREKIDDGKRVIASIKQILQNAQNSTEKPGENYNIYFGKAPQEGLQNYALTGIKEETKEEKKEETKKEEKPEQKVEKKPEQQNEEKVLPVTGM